MSTASLLQPEDRVLSTLNSDGSRRWLRPRLARGRFWQRRRAVAYGLIALFVSLPWITVGGKPAVLLDVVGREFTILGKTFLPTDTLLLMLLVVGVFLSVFFVTALFGRVWCGWACPQTVYMEFVFRPIERWAEGKPARRGLRKGVQYALYALISFALAHTFLSYFVGVDQLRHWITASPAAHPVGFGVVVFVTGAMLFDFALFREQTCIVACPYGRFQSVLLDRDSMVVSYDRRRGEPRGRKTRGKPAAGGDVALPIVQGAADARTGDCVDCTMCVQVCPTGIDIRDGLQMECINCTQCIDACDAVMDKLKRPRGLVRYSSQHAAEGGRTRLVRPRVLVYPTIIALVAAILVWRLASMQSAYVSVQRGRGMPFTALPSGEIANNLKVRIVNRSPDDRQYLIEVLAPQGAHLSLAANPLPVPKGKLIEEGVVVEAPRSAFVSGQAEARLAITDGRGLRIEKTYRLLGPTGPAPKVPTP